MSIYAQRPDILWNKTIGGTNYDYGKSSVNTSDGGFFVAGISMSDKSGDKTESRFNNSNCHDYWLIKLNSAGQKVWDKIYGGSGNDILSKIIPTKDGGYVLAGCSFSDISETKSQNSFNDTFDYWIIKINENGEKIWDKTYGGDSDDYLRSIFENEDGSIILVGESYSNSSGNKSANNFGGTDNWVLKLDNIGNKIWDKSFGGTSNENALSIINTVDNGYLIAGKSNSEIGGNKESSKISGDDGWLIKIDQNGEKIWDKTYGSSIQTGYGIDYFVDIENLNDGNYIIAGQKDYWSYWVIKINSNGEIIWDKKYLGGTGGNSYLNDIKILPNNEILLLGESNCSIYPGTLKTENSKGGYDIWIVKTNSLGDVLWDKTIGGNLQDTAGNLIIDTDGSYTICGSSLSTISGDKTENSKGKDDIWIQKLSDNNNQGNIKKIIGTIFKDKGEKVQDNNPNLYVSLVKNGVLYKTNKLNGSKFSFYNLGIGTYKLSIHINPNGSLNSILPLGYNSFLNEGQLGTSGDGNNNGEIDFDVTQNGLIINQNIVTNSELKFIIQKQKSFWDKTIGGNRLDKVKSILQTPDGGFLVLGSSISPPSGDKTIGGVSYYQYPDFWLVKLLNSGEIEWERTYGVEFTNDSPEKLLATSDGGYILAGSSDNSYTQNTSYGKTAPSKGNHDYWLIKLNSNFEKVWDKTYGGSNHDYLRDVINTSDGGLILVGSSKSNEGSDKSEPLRGVAGSYGYDYWVVKLNSNGDKIWDKTLGGELDDYARGIIETPDGGFIINGISYSGVSYDKTVSDSAPDYWIVKINSNGQKIWDKSISGIYLNLESDLSYTTISANDGFIFTDYGYTTTSLISKNYKIYKVNWNGDIVWQKNFGGNSDDILSSIKNTEDGGFILAGSSMSGISDDKSLNNLGGYDYWVIKLNNDGEKVWDKVFGTPVNDFAIDISETSDGGFMVGGYSEGGISEDKSEISRGDYDYWVVKIPNESFLAGISGEFYKMNENYPVELNNSYISLIKENLIISTLKIEGNNFKFQNITDGTYKLILHNNPNGSLIPSLPNGFNQFIKEGNFNDTVGDNNPDGILEFTFSNGSYSVSNARVLPLGKLKFILKPNVAFPMTCTTTKSGDWNDPTVWSCGVVPTNLDDVIISPTHIITMPDSYTGQANNLENNGNLIFGQNATLNLTGQ